jgi:hypothetical protein
LTPRELLASLPEGATPGPWYVAKDGQSILQTSHITRDVWTIPRTDADMHLCAAAPALRDALAEVLAENERLRALLDEARVAVGDVQMSDDDLHDLVLRIEAALVASVSE